MNMYMGTCSSVLCWAESCPYSQETCINSVAIKIGNHDWVRMLFSHEYLPFLKITLKF